MSAKKRTNGRSIHFFLKQMQRKKNNIYTPATTQNAKLLPINVPKAKAAPNDR